MRRFTRLPLVPLLLVIALLFIVMPQLFNNNPRGPNVTYGQFVQQVDHNAFSISSVLFNPKSQSVNISYRNGNVATVHYATAEAQIQLQNELQKKGIPFDSLGTGGTPWGTILAIVLPIFFILVLWILIMRQMQGGANKIMGFGSSRHRTLSPTAPKITFKDVAGLDEAVEELDEIRAYLENPQRFQALGARIPRGVLLYGPPGSGKTLLARAVAGEAGVPFLSISGSDFVEMFVGVGASVSGDTPILIRDRNKTRLLPIAVFVDRYYENNINTEGYVPLREEVETLGYRQNAYSGRKGGFGGSSWSSLRGVYRHKVKEIFEIEYLGGILRTTGDHSVFVRGHGGIKVKKARELTSGDVLVNLPYKVHREFDPENGTLHEIRNHEFKGSDSIALPIEEIDPEPVVAHAYVMANVGVLSQYEIAASIGRSQTTVGNWQRHKHEPFGISRLRQRTVIPGEVELTPNLMRLFGYYTAEGFANGALRFCFGTHEDVLIKDCARLIRQNFSTEPIVTDRPESHSTVIMVRSAPLARFFAAQCGHRAKNKHVPEILWSLPRDYFLSYLEGYANGDGYTTKEGKLSITSVSHQLIRELTWLCAMHGIKAGVRHGRLKEGRIINAKPLPDGEYWSLIIGKTSHPFAPIWHSCEHKKPVVRKVTAKPYDGYVYDLCGCDNEAFFGGEKPILLHNSRVRSLFQEAKKDAPSIVFVDELDAVGRQRGAGTGNANDERENTLNQLLVEMDGFEINDNVIVIAATNRPDILDPALLRPGRFDRQIIIDRPDRRGRRQILAVHTKGKPLDKTINLDTLAAGTPGFTGADLANLVNEAALLAARQGKSLIEQADLEEGIMRVVAGPEKRSQIMSDEEKKITAYHELGHALVGHFLKNTDDIHKISIVSRGQALGYTISLPHEDRYLITRSNLLDQLAMSLGGRVAEKIVFNDITTGAANDLEKVTQTAKQMVMRYGMSDKLGPRVLGHNQDLPFLGKEFQNDPDYSEKVAKEIDEEIHKLILDAQKKAEALLSEHRHDLDRLAKLLVKYETINREQFEKLLAGASEREVFSPGSNKVPRPPSKKKKTHSSAEPPFPDFNTNNTDD